MRAEVATLFALAACAGAPRAPVVDAESYLYDDNSGLTVSTTAITAAVPVAARVTVTARAVADRVELARTALDPADTAPGGAHAGHEGHDHDADVVTSASAFAAGGAVASKWRFEGIGGVEVRGGGGASGVAPWRAGLRARASHEPDYRSASATLSGGVELAARNFVLGGFVGLGHDVVDPVEAPPGQGDDWPASHDRIVAGLSGAQTVSPHLVLRFGGGLTWQHGALANPYRRALVRTTLFPEVVPDERVRVTGFGGLSWSMAAAWALHLRHGLYRDDWGVLALAPEAILAWAPGDVVLVAARYRYTWQGRADFYRARYDDLAPLMSGDVRLGSVRVHDLGLEGRWRPGRAWLARLVLGLSLTEYVEMRTETVVGTLVGVAVAWTP